ncbi:MAG: NAD(P)/FAD-dependent oxidoreductase, partial [Dehalococcoidia bacterium]
LFLVGDSAGQCLPLTGEGIRSSIFFGLLCGGIVRQVSGGTRSLEQGLRLYAQEVRRYRRFYRMFFQAQWAFIRAPERVAAAAVAFLVRGSGLRYVQDHYEVLSELPLDGKDMKPPPRGFGAEGRGLSPARTAFPKAERE